MMESKRMQLYDYRRSSIVEGVLSEFQRGFKSFQFENEKNSGDEREKISLLLEKATEPEVLMAEMSSEGLTSFATYSNQSWWRGKLILLLVLHQITLIHVLSIYVQEDPQTNDAHYLHHQLNTICHFLVLENQYHYQKWVKFQFPVNLMLLHLWCTWMGCITLVMRRCNRNGVSVICEMIAKYGH